MGETPNPREKSENPTRKSAKNPREVVGKT